MREESKQDLAALYYNTITLHEGAHWADDKGWWKKDRRVDNYRDFLYKLFGDVTKFFDLVSSSGRKAVVIFVPEHGMAVRGDTLQPAGLREIPLPRITKISGNRFCLGKRGGKGCEQG